MLAACKLDVRIAARDFLAKTEKFAEETSERFKDSGAKLIAYNDANEAVVDGADVIVVKHRSSMEPVFDANR